MQATHEHSQPIVDYVEQAEVTAISAHPSQSIADYAAQHALRYAAPVGILVGLAVLFLNLSRNPVPFIDDPRGFGTIFFVACLLIALVGGSVAYVMGTRFRNAQLPAEYQRWWVLGVLPIGLAYLVV